MALPEDFWQRKVERMRSEMEERLAAKDAEIAALKSSPSPSVSEEELARVIHASVPHQFDNLRWEQLVPEDQNVVRTMARAVLSHLHLKAGTGGQWQPIETAPKDGRFIVFEPTTGRGRVLMADRVTAGTTLLWRRVGGHSEDFFVKPTHWMPLPPPPGEKQALGESVDG